MFERRSMDQTELGEREMSTIRKILVLVMLASMLLAACGPSETQAPAATEPPAAPGEKVTINLATWAGAEESNELQAVIDQVNAEATDFEIVHQANPADYYTKIQTMIAGNTAPDLMWLSQEYVANFADNGAILDITDQVAALSDMPAAQLDDYYPGSIAVAQYNGRLYGLPWIAQPVVLYYNPELFEAAGVAPPDDTWTWDTRSEERRVGNECRWR